MPDTLKNIKAQAADWLFKGLLAIVLWLVKDMHSDVKFLMQTMPVHEVRLSTLETNVSINRFKIIQIPMKNEDQITYDSLIDKRN
jgi:hypothetical protein